MHFPFSLSFIRKFCNSNDRKMEKMFHYVETEQNLVAMWTKIAAHLFERDKRVHHKNIDRWVNTVMRYEIDLNNEMLPCEETGDFFDDKIRWGSLLAMHFHIYSLNSTNSNKSQISHFSLQIARNSEFLLNNLRIWFHSIFMCFRM